MTHSKGKPSLKKKKFLQLPKYPGGSQALKRFFSDNLQYPEEAMAQKMEGDVIVKFTVDDEGKVIEAHIDKGIGHGCDEEALRLVRLLKYQPVRNRGVRVTASLRTRIPFRLKGPQAQMRVTYLPAADTKKEDHLPEKEKEKENVYHYSIRIR